MAAYFLCAELEKQHFALVLRLKHRRNWIAVGIDPEFHVFNSRRAHSKLLLFFLEFQAP
jgi:hypothetical protein